MFNPDTHPKQTFLFYVENELTDKNIEDIKAIIDSLSTKLDWTIDSPKFINEIEQPENSLDAPIQTVGATFEVFSALPPLGEYLPKEIDKAHFREVRELIDTFKKISTDSEISINLSLDDTEVGVIKGGIPDIGISETLLGEWEKALF